jgi:Flp pilus assembly protein TadG
VKKGDIQQELRRDDGAAAVEFALIAPLLFMLIFGIIQFGIAWSQKEIFVQAAREGARYAAVACEKTACNSGEVAQRVRDASVGYTLSQNPTVTPNPGCSTTNTSDTVTVSWNQQFSISLPFVPPINTTAPIEAVFRCER